MAQEVNRMPTYNDTLSRMDACTLIVGVLYDGTGVIIKNRHGQTGEIPLPELVPILSNVLLQRTGIEFFDDAMKADLSKSILTVLARHCIKHGINTKDLQRRYDGYGEIQLEEEGL